MLDCRLLVFHGPIREAVPFFESLGFKCPERKDHASFLQEVTTPKGKPAEPSCHIQATGLGECIHVLVFAARCSIMSACKADAADARKGQLCQLIAAGSAPVLQAESLKLPVHLCQQFRRLMPHNDLVLLMPHDSRCAHESPLQGGRFLRPATGD